MTDFIVKVSFDSDSAMWVAVCDELAVVTEAASYEALIERVWEIAPEIYELNSFGSAHEKFKLSFMQTVERVLA